MFWSINFVTNFLGSFEIEFKFLWSQIHKYFFL
jgi:hypothetical protein